MLGFLIFDPGDDEATTMLQALGIKLGLFLRDAEAAQLLDQVLTGPAALQQPLRAGPALAAQNAHLFLRNVEPAGGAGSHRRRGPFDPRRG